MMDKKFEKKKVTSWFDSQKKTIVFGLKAYYCGNWYNLSDNGKPLFFDTKKEANNFLKTIN